MSAASPNARWLAIYLTRIRTDRLIRAGLAICIGGALSNALDRAIYGAVADFFHVHWGDLAFPYIFNVADVMITIGVGLLLLDLVGIGGRKAANAA